MNDGRSAPSNGLADGRQTGVSPTPRYLADGADRTDVVRQDLFPEPTYTDEERHAVYGALFDRARSRLDRGASVVLDGTFAATTHRERAVN